MDKLILENSNGDVVRSFRWDSNEAQVVFRNDLRRVEVWNDQTKKDVDASLVKHLGEINKSQLSKSAFKIGEFGELKFISSTARVPSEIRKKEKSKTWHYTIGVFAVVAILISFLLGRVSNIEKPEEKELLKQKVVQLMKRAKIESPKAQENKQINQQTQEKAKPKQVNLQNVGALKVLGRLSQGQKGGLNLGAIQTTRGPGLGGNAGSGGVQTAYYAKGLVGAALGPGANISGQGGYGTKGKGGGQDGYGSLSLVGSAKAMPVGLTGEAEVDEGLDRDAIAAVIQKNLGQIRFCYEQGLQGDPKLAGRVAVSFVIDGNGAVKSGSVAHTSLQSKVVEDCVLLRLRSWKFPLPRGGVDVKVVYPFVLQRTGI